MAKATIDSLQHALTYILIMLLPFIFTWFGSLLKITVTQLYHCCEWHQLSNQLCLPLCHFPVKHCKKKLSMRSFLLAKWVPVPIVSTSRSIMALQYLLLLAIFTYKVGCQIKLFLKIFRQRLQRPHMLQ
jgi:hypothetical protein